MTTVKMNAAAIGGTLQLQATGTVVVPADGIITVDSRDAAQLLLAGASYINSVTRWQSVSAARLATAGQIVASAALGNGTLTIAHQPDVPRQIGLRVDPGTTAITAGNVAMTYIANDGTTQVDNVSAVTAASTLFTVNSSKGVLHLTSAIVTAMAGGTSPKVQINDTNALSMVVDGGFVDFSVLKANVDGADEAIGTVTSSAASIVPNTAPDGTHTFGFAYNYNMPNT